MEIDKLVHIVKNPINSNCKDIEIESLKSKFPYCQTFTLISMMQKHQQGVFGFEEELEQSAHKIIDRGILHDYLHNESKFETEASTAIESIEAEPQIEQEKIIDEIDLVQPIEVITPIIDQPKEEVKKNFTELDFDIINSAIDSSIQLEVDEELEKTQQLEEKIQEKETVETHLENENSLVEPILDVPSSMEEFEEQEAIDSSPKSFISWLKSQDSDPATKGEIKEIPDSSTLKDAELKVEIDKELAKKKILEKFILDEPRISKPKKEFFSPTKKAKESLTENDDLITETLAKIYVLQKNYNKAIDAYERLSLIYPEKNTFFANQIQRIKDKQNI
jgi:hypothetical protein